MSAHPFSVVLAATLRDGIGLAGRLPWGPGDLPGELAHFRELTAGGAVIMGRRTWESLELPGGAGLPGRLNLVVSGTMRGDVVVRQNERAQRGGGGVAVCRGLEEALRAAEAAGRRAFVIGGERLFRQALLSPACERVHLTRVLSDPECDTFAPALEPRDYELERCHPPEADGRYQRLVYRRRHEERQYLDLVRRALQAGEARPDRTGTGTLSSFGAAMTFSLRGRTVPVLTTKRVFWKGVVEELLWMLRGRTDSKELAARGVHIWDGNGSRAFLDALGLGHREEGDLGPVYGFQWRHFGAAYEGCRADHAGRGVDQLAEVVRLIREEPASRRILMTAWNPAELRNVALPACHVLCQFYCAEGGGLSCAMYQRSADVMLGVPFNVAFYSLLTHLLADLTGRTAVSLHHFVGDAHVYANHVEGAREQLRREPRPFPTLAALDGGGKELRAVEDLERLGLADLRLVGYNPHPAIKMAMAV